MKNQKPLNEFGQNREHQYEKLIDHSIKELDVAIERRKILSEKLRRLVEKSKHK
jgi:hypothetical protein